MWNRAATVELLVIFYEQFHRKWLAVPGVFGVVRKETVYELFYTTLPPHAFTASDMLHKTLFVWFVLSGHVQLAPLFLSILKAFPIGSFAHAKMEPVHAEVMLHFSEKLAPLIR